MEPQNSVFRNQNPVILIATDQDLKLFITPIDREKSLRNVSMLKIAKSIQNCIGSSPEFIKSTRNGILVKCKDTKQHKKLSDIQIIDNVPVKVNLKLDLKKGVISDIPTEMSEKEIETELKSQKVVNVKRIVRKNRKREEPQDGNVHVDLVPTRSVIVSFEATVLPQDIILCFQRIKVKPYIPSSPRCFKCQRYGHTIAVCKQKQRCVRCGEEHSFDDCIKKDTPKCVNCGGEHSAAYNGCEQAQKAQEVQKIKVLNNLSYAQAARQLKEEKDNMQAQAPIPLERKLAPPQQHLNTANNPQPSVDLGLNTVKQNHPTPQVDNSHLFPDHTPKADPPLPQRQDRQTSEKTGRPSSQIKENFITKATNEELITFFLHLMIQIMKDKSEGEVLSLIKIAAGQLLMQAS